MTSEKNIPLPSITTEMRVKITLQRTNISPFEGTFEDDFPFPKVGYVSFLEGTPLRCTPTKICVNPPAF